MLFEISQAGVWNDSDVGPKKFESDGVGEKTDEVVCSMRAACAAQIGLRIAVFIATKLARNACVPFFAFVQRFFTAKRIAARISIFIEIHGFLLLVEFN